MRVFSHIILSKSAINGIKWCLLKAAYSKVKKKSVKESKLFKKALRFLKIKIH